MEDLGIKLDALTLDDLGTAGRITIDKDSTTVVDGGGADANIKARVGRPSPGRASSTTTRSCKSVLPSSLAESPSSRPVLP